MRPKIALITGATSGIGQATAEVFADHQIDLIVCGRRAERLDALEKTLQNKVNIHKLVFDVRDREVVLEKIASLPAEWQNIDILVNNAGNAHGLAPFHESDIDDWDAMLDINVKGLLYVSKAVVPGMVARQQGHIVNIGSIAGKEVYPKGHVYCASKYAVDAINQGMRIDLHSHNIRVSAINPGLVNTEFSAVRFKGDQEKADLAYKGLQPLLARDIAEIIAFVVTRPAHVNIADLLVLPTAQASATVVDRRLG
ncbi:MAG: SDR family NAD(P)-dependent oxidoreductase [Microscillaceae bacterium]|nr:SDR family NAD(P)-dependent oxidoreductase [Microscillaceae bacterium]